MSRQNFTANKIHRLGETGSAAVHVPPTSICPNEIKQAGSVISREKMVNFAVCFFYVVSAIKQDKKCTSSNTVRKSSI